MFGSSTIVSSREGARAQRLDLTTARIERAGSSGCVARRSAERASAEMEGPEVEAPGRRLEERTTMTAAPVAAAKRASSVMAF